MNDPRLTSILLSSYGRAKVGGGFVMNNALTYSKATSHMISARSLNA